jgi:chromosome segregation ATPase
LKEDFERIQAAYYGVVKERDSASLTGKELQKTIDQTRENVAEFTKKVKELEAKNKGLEEELKATKEELRTAKDTQSSHQEKTNIDEEVRKQLEAQIQKNQELRERNYKILDALNALEQTTKKMLAGNEQKDDGKLSDVISASQELIRSVAPDAHLPSMNGTTSLEAYLQWINECIITVKNTPKTTAKKSETEKSEKEMPANWEKEIEGYKRALSQVLVQVEHIGKEAQKLDAQRRARIAQLEKTIEQFPTSASQKGSANGEHRERHQQSPVTEDWEVVEQ